jgi:hypothetical protein
MSPVSASAALSRAAKTLSKLGASKGGKARAAHLTPEQRKLQSRNAVAARWARTNGGRLTQDQQRVVRRLAGLEMVELVISAGPQGRRRRVAIEQLVAAGKLKILEESGDTIAICPACS